MFRRWILPLSQKNVPQPGTIPTTVQWLPLCLRETSSQLR